MNRARSIFIRAIGTTAAIVAVTCAAKSRAEILTQHMVRDGLSKSPNAAPTERTHSITFHLSPDATTAHVRLMASRVSVGYFTGLSKATAGPSPFDPAAISTIDDVAFESFLSMMTSDQTRSSARRVFFASGK